MPTYVLSRDIVIQQWGYVIEQGAGNDKMVMDSVKQMIEDANLPGVTCRQTDVSTGGIFGRKRAFLLTTLNTLKDYRMFIGARDVGAHLEASWFMTVAPGFMKRSMSKRAFGNPQALSMQIPIFDQQDLNTWIGVAEHCVEKAVKTLMEELKQDTSGLNTRSKGFLQLW